MLCRLGNDCVEACHGRLASPLTGTTYGLRTIATDLPAPASSTGQCYSLALTKSCSLGRGVFCGFHVGGSRWWTGTEGEDATCCACGKDSAISRCHLRRSLKHPFSTARQVKAVFVVLNNNRDSPVVFGRFLVGIIRMLKRTSRLLAIAQRRPALGPLARLQIRGNHHGGDTQSMRSRIGTILTVAALSAVATGTGSWLLLRTRHNDDPHLQTTISYASRAEMDFVSNNLERAF